MRVLKTTILNVKTAVKSVIATAVVLGVGAGVLAPGALHAQQSRDTGREIPAPTFATTRSQAALTPSGAVRYDDLGAADGGFVLEQRGSMVLLQMDGTNEILTLVPVPGVRGDTVFMDYRGRSVLKVTRAGNVVSYLHNEEGAPADPRQGMLPPLSAPAMSAALDRMRASAVSELSRLAGREVTVWGTQSFASTEAFAADALSIIVIGVRNANGQAGRAAAQIEKVTLRRAKAPRVMLGDGELVIEVNPDDPWAGRVTPDEVTRVLTQARAAG